MDAAIIGRIALETAMPESSVAAVAELFEKGATGPFIFHYRKEATGGLDEGKIRSIQERIAYYKEVWNQRASLLKMLSEQGKLTDELRTRIESCFAKAELDDLHHQFRPRRKTRAMEAIEKGLEPLAEYFWNQELDAWSVEEHIDVFVDPAKGITTREQALQGVVDIIAEWIWANIEYRKKLRDMLWSEGSLISSVVPAKVGQKTKYNMYYDRRESVTAIPSHRVLAIRRGCKEGILVSSIEGDNAKALDFLLTSVIKETESIFAPVLEAAVRESYSRLLRPLIETEVRTQLKERADREAIKVFQENLANLLLSPPAGPIVVMGIDWGKGDECNIAVVDEAGQILEISKIRLAASPKSSPAPNTQKSKHQKADATSDQATPNKSVATPPEEKPKPQDPAPEPGQADLPGVEGREETASEQPLAEAEVQNEAAEDAPAADAAAITDPPVTAPLDAPASATEEKAAEKKTIQAESEPGEAASDGAPPSGAPVEESHETAIVANAGNSEPQVTESSPAADNAQAADTPEDVPDNAASVTKAATAEALPAADQTESEAAALPEVPEKSEAKNNSTSDEKALVTDTEQSAETDQEEENPRQIVKDLITKHSVRAIAIGTGTGSRELQIVLRQIVQEESLGDIPIAAVNDAGIAIYSSSRIAREEFPDWSASARCAVSLARRLQDPLSELVKIDPKLIGVGQYQHDVDQKELHRGLLQTVQYCVNKVGVNVNTAGESILRYVSGLNDKLARRIVAHRSANGLYRSRDAILSSVGMDEFNYQQAAAFLRIPDGENGLDRTAVHPESYAIVEKMASTLGVEINDLIGNKERISSLKLEDFAAETVGIPTLNDIREELLKPGRDPRKTFKAPKFRTDVTAMADLKPGMTLEGTVTNVTNFGAFVDIGVRQDGLVHLSQMSNRFIRDPREAVKVGDVVKVKVISVESETKRIGLSMKALLPTAQRRRKKQQRRGSKHSSGSQSQGHSGEGDASPTAEGASPPGVRRKSSRPHQGSARNRRRGSRKPGGPDAQRNQKESGPKGPEPTLQEKIAILQSKFRRIN